MGERCFIRVRWDPASTPGVKRAVGGFLRYIQHRDLHPDSERPPTSDVWGLVKYVAYRDRASHRAELFGPVGVAGSHERKQFAEYVTRSIADSRPQLYRGRDGRVLDRRQAVSRFVISPEAAAGLDLEQLVRAGVSGLETESAISGLRWIAAIHRNTKHHHVHLVVAGLQRRDDGTYVRVDITKRRLAAIKDAVYAEIERQRGERSYPRPAPMAGPALGGNLFKEPALKPLAFAPRLIRTPPTARSVRAGSHQPRIHRIPADPLSGSILRLRAAARRYQRRMQHDAEDEARRMQREHGR